jgi:hypothetical protein
MVLSDETGERIARVVAGVVQQAVEDAGAAGVVVLEPDSPEGRLAVAWSVRLLGADRVWRIDPDGASGNDVGGSPDRREEFRRGVARVLARDRNGLLMHPANKTALLLDPFPPPEPLLPLGDLYATHVARLSDGAWTGSDGLHELADAAGGIETLDAALAAIVEGRAPAARALGHLPEAVRRGILQRWEAGRFWRRRPGLVPKLGARTLGIDLFA